MQTFAITKFARKITILRKEKVYFVCFMDNKKFHCREIAKSDGAAHNVVLFSLLNNLVKIHSNTTSLLFQKNYTILFYLPINICIFAPMIKPLNSK